MLPGLCAVFASLSRAADFSLVAVAAESQMPSLVSIYGPAPHFSDGIVFARQEKGSLI